MFDTHVHKRTEYITKTELVPYEKTINIKKPSTAEDLELLIRQKEEIVNEYLGSTVAKLSGIFNVEVLISKFEDPTSLDNNYFISFKTSNGILRDRVSIKSDEDIESTINILRNKICDMVLSQINIPCLYFNSEKRN